MTILQPGYVRWDGTKYVIDPSVEIIGPPGPAGPQGEQGIQGPPGSGVIVGIVSVSNGLLQWTDPDIDPTLTQVDNTTNSGTGHTLTIQAQNQTGTSSTGGNVALRAGTGTSADGYIEFLTGNNSLGYWSIIGNYSTFTTNASRTGLSFKTDIIQSDATQFIFSNILNNCQISQINRTVGDGYDLTIQAQNATAGGSTGGDLILTSGTGVTTNGKVLIKVDGTTLFEGGDSFTNIFGTSIFINSDTQISLTANGTPVLDLSDTAFNVNVNGTCEILGTSILLNNIGINATTNTVISFAAFLSSCSIIQNDNTTSSAVGSSFTLHAQNATGTTATGGALVLASGTGTSASGSFTLKHGANNFLRVTSNNSISLLYGNVRWDAALGAVSITQDDNVAASGTGATMNIAGQNATGTTSVGGSVVIASGTGTSLNGSLILRTGSTARFTANSTGIAFYNGSPVAQQTRAGQLTNTHGTGSSTIADVGSSFNQTVLNNIIRSLSDKHNALENIIHNLRLST